MNPGRLFLPRFGPNIGPITGANYLPIKGNFGLFKRITSSLSSFNWNGLLNGANKTLNVVNQTIPLVRQAGPMFNNMRSMLRLAKVFGNETMVNIRKESNLNASENNVKLKSNVNTFDDVDTSEEKENVDGNYPNFFI